MQVRFLDFGDVVPKTGIIGAARHLKWPVDGYRISLPRTIDDSEGLNPFEKVIMGIMRVDHLRDVKSISRETCLESDFVDGVLLRLRDKGLVDDQNWVTTEGAKQLEDSRGGLELRTAWLFRELVSGKLLPFVYLPDGDNPPRCKKEPPFAKSVPAARMRFGAPSPEEVLSSMRETKRRVEGYGRTVHLPRVGQIDVSPNPERFFLDCPIVMRDTDGRWRIADPFGYGYSRELEEVFLQEMETSDELQNWLMKWSDSLVVDSGDGVDDSVASYASQDIRQQYPGLSQNLRLRKDGTRAIGQVYAAIEWALFYSCRIHGFDDKVPELRYASPKDQVAMVRRAMAEIGCDLSGFVAPVSKGDINNYLAGSAEMKTVLPMAILQAADDPSHPLRSFCAQHPDFVARIGRMKERRDAPLHGGESERYVQENAPDDLFMKDLVSTLLPQVNFGAAQTSDIETDVSVFRNINFNAENSIMGEFGPAVPYLKMTRGTRESLLSAERFWLTFEGEENIQPFLNDYYAALQSTFDAEIVSDRVSRPGNKLFDPCATAVERCERLGLGELPGGLLSAKKAFIRDALQGGGNHTLGPSLIVYLALAEETKLTAIEASVPGYIEEICELIKLRGHGNGYIPSTKDEARLYRTFAFDVIKAVLEV